MGTSRNGQSNPCRIAMGSLVFRGNTVNVARTSFRLIFLRDRETPCIRVRVGAFPYPVELTKTTAGMTHLASELTYPPVQSEGTDDGMSQPDFAERLGLTTILR